MKFKIPTNIFAPKKLSAVEHWLAVTLFVLSLVTISAIVVDYGFLLDDSELRVVHLIYRLSWWCYLLLYIVQLIFGWRNIKKKSIFLTAFVGVLFILSALLRYFQSGSTDVPFFLDYLFVEKILLLLLSLLDVSRGIVDFINKKTNPAMLMALCFAVLIAVGTILLLLPRSTLDGVRLSVIDAFFISTSAVCVTGLSPLDIAHTFSYEGQIVLLLLIQAGGLGVMTITSFFALFFMGGTGLYNQFALRDMLGSDTFGSLISTLLNIIGFTMLIEFIGALGIWLSVRGTLGLALHQELFFSLFHSVSSFCNAGFSTLSNNLGNSAIVTGHNTFFLIITALVVLGSLGYPILVNFKKIILYYIKQFVGLLFRTNATQLRYSHIMNINTKIVLTMSAVLLAGGTLSI
ncbi:MAG: potassium transporter, partial [Bacteroidaceae bacterium]|nr:potassium transporter [Bacteroidaceae bacterium]